MERNGFSGAGCVSKGWEGKGAQRGPESGAGKLLSPAALQGRILGKVSRTGRLALSDNETAASQLGITSAESAAPLPSRPKCSRCPRSTWCPGASERGAGAAHWVLPETVSRQEAKPARQPLWLLRGLGEQASGMSQKK